MQRGQLEKILKENVAKQKALTKEIPALRAQIAGLDYELVMGEVAAQKSAPATKMAAAPAFTKAAPAATKASDPFAGLKKLFGIK